MNPLCSVALAVLIGWTTATKCLFKRINVLLINKKLAAAATEN